MAKLSARGRREWVRATRETPTPDSKDTLWDRTTITYLSDGTILTKRETRFRATSYMKEHTHSYGWKKGGRWKVETPLDELRARLTASGWTLADVAVAR